MRYAKTKKHETREQILRNAYRRFSTLGFDAVSIDDVMRDCALTRGGFYAHFASKASLYREAIKYAALTGQLSLPQDDKNAASSLARRLHALFDECAINERSPQDSLAFLARDLGNKPAEVRAAYALAVETILDQLASQADIRPNDQLITSALSMVIGAAAIVQTVDNIELRDKLKAACSHMSTLLSNSLENTIAPAFLWEGVVEGGMDKTATLN